MIWRATQHQLKGSQPSHLGNIIQIYSNQNRIVLAQRQIVEQWSRIQSSEMKLHQFSQMVNKCAKMTHRGKTAPSTNNIGKLAAYVKKPNVGPYLASWTNTNLIWIKNLNVWPKSLKLLEENIWEKLNNLKFNNDFLDMTPTSYEKKKRESRHMWLHQTNNVCIKDLGSSMERQPVIWKNMFKMLCLIRGWYSEYIRNYYH